MATGTFPLEGERPGEAAGQQHLLLLVDGTDDTAAVRTVQVLAAHWKFSWSVRRYGEDAREPAPHAGRQQRSVPDGAATGTPGSPCASPQILVHYREKNPGFESWCVEILEGMHCAKVLLVDTCPKEYGAAIQAFFGVKGVREKGRGARKLTVADASEPVLQGIGSDLLLAEGRDPASVVVPLFARKLLLDEAGDSFLCRMGRAYALGIPLWQFGVPGFPHLFPILRNFLFLAEGRGHFSPYPYVSLRIDDFPLTSEHFQKSGGVCDAEREREVDTLCRWSEEYGARLEFMVNSRLLTREGRLVPLDRVVPQSLATLHAYYKRGVVNVNAHGRSHIDEDTFRRTGEISPFEFAALDAGETDAHLSDCAAFISRSFGKRATGFVPPSWGYREGVTKTRCGDFFDFVVDSAANYRNGCDLPATGFVDGKGTVHLMENWHLGFRDFDHTERSLWTSFAACGIPVHMMAHGPYLSDPIPPGTGGRCAALVLYAALLPLLLLARPAELCRLLRAVFSGRRWDRLGLLRKVLVRLPRFRKSSVRSLLSTGAAVGVRWTFAEGLAVHLREYTGLAVTGYRVAGPLHEIEFCLERDLTGSLLFHPAAHPVAADVDGMALAGAAPGRPLELSSLRRGAHTLTIRTIESC